MIEIAVAALSGGALANLLRTRSQNRLDRAQADSVMVNTAEKLVEGLRAEMDRKVSDLTREVGRLRGLLESKVHENDLLLRENRTLRSEMNALPCHQGPCPFVKSA